MRQTLAKHLTSVGKLSEDFTRNLRSFLPIEYKTLAEGKVTRAEVSEHVPGSR